MEIATIVPVPHLSLTRPDPYQMCLAHLLQHPWYLQYFHEIVDRGSFVLMDNGVVENGVPLDPDRLLAIYLDLSPTEIILPDCPGDGQRTLDLGNECMDCFQRHLTEEQFSRVRFLAVPQGKDREEWQRCAEVMYQEWPITTFGVSKLWLRSHYIGGELQPLFPDRLEATRELLKIEQRLGPGRIQYHGNANLQYHWLGVNVNPRYSDLQKLLCEPDLWSRVRGVDSGVATIYTVAGEEIGAEGEKPSVDPDFFAPVQDEELLRMNISFWRGACRIQILE